MEEICEKLPCNVLTAEALFENKGITCCIVENVKRSLSILPKNEMKHYEPNNSWLQNVQIEKGLLNRRDLLSIERVERASELAIAEWIAAEKKAFVTKRSGLDWSSFGVEKNGVLYLLPEEALFLLETNCLELLWNKFPCSIQQAYAILIDDSVCTLEEYRVYSQLSRYGYHIKRYLYEELEKYKLDEPVSKRKMIVNPENGLRICDNQSQIKQTTEKSKETPKNIIDTHVVSPCTKNQQNVAVEEPVEQIVHDVMNNLLDSVEDKKTNFDISKKLGNNTPQVKWPGVRIQRNVKQLPKRTDKVSSPEISIINFDENRKYGEKRKSLIQISESSKKLKHEVIDLSDDEIQELPRSMTRMEMLNLLPNIAFKSDITGKILKRYIPHNIKPQKTIYHYSRTKIKHMQEVDQQVRRNCKNIRNNARQNVSQYRNPINNRSDPFPNQQLSLYNPSRQLFPVNQVQSTSFDLPYLYRFPFNYGTNICVQDNIFIAFGNQVNALQQSRRLTIQMNNFTTPIMERFPSRMRHFFAENQFRHIFYQNFLWQQRFFQRRMMENIPGNTHLLPRGQWTNFNRNSQASQEIVNRPSFITCPGTNSWTELKKRWSEEKTITIDDEDHTIGNEECNEVQIVKRSDPLVSSRSASSLTEIFNKLAIIKSAPERTVRRKKNKYKISYNVYSCAHYKKSNPGQPLYSLVIIRKDDSPTFLQPVELNRLQQDAKGSQIIIVYVSMSILYIQPGIITMPNIT
ncbi:uncharacterized protein LOC109858478 isoform X2 [Pseudomyrmex gracilis]|uniref:uncharacterized protein LOC109858478 isoform X2 n=1 Tax=Pseudomyrmex gracilis TaxID=219809 RepID=UPI00099585DF|nr:uncharacterized protein LOC109858478 isoform X2 [Pseudomyrmex gracilis]